MYKLKLTLYIKLTTGRQQIICIYLSGNTVYLFVKCLKKIADK